MKFRKLLKKLSKKSTHIRYHHAAVVAQGKRILGTGWNIEGHHAEEMALWRAGENSKGATLYTLMVRKRSGGLGDGSPCSMCMEHIRKWKIRRVVVYV